MSATDSENPLLIAKGLPAYDRIRAEHIQPAVDVMLNRCRQILQTIEASSDCSWQSLMEPMEEIDLMFEYGWSPIGHLLSVANADDLRDAHEAAMPSIVEFSLEVRQSEAIYGRLRQLKDSDKWQLLDHAQQRIIEKSIQSAELSGIALQGQQRERFNEIGRASCRERV